MLFIGISDYFFLDLMIGVIYEMYLDIRMAGREDLGVEQRDWLAVRAGMGQLSAIIVSHVRSELYGAFVWARMALNGPKRRFPAWAGDASCSAYQAAERPCVWWR